MDSYFSQGYLRLSESQKDKAFKNFTLLPID